MDDKLKVVKIGGQVIDDAQALQSFLIAFSKIPGKKILVHGGGKLATRMSKLLGVEVTMQEGRRITTDENLKIVTMVYAGLINKQICALLQSQGCNAIGLSGADADCIQSTKRKPTPVDYGWVGDVNAVSTDNISLFLENGITPVFCAITHDGEGQLLNTNADTVAAEVAIATSQQYDTDLLYCFEKAGVLTDVDDELSVIPQIDQQDYQRLKLKGIVQKGMIPKLDNCFYALDHEVSNVYIGNTEVITPHASTAYTQIV